MSKRIRDLSLILTWSLSTLPAAFSQTQLDLGNQTRNVNFVNAASTKPFKTGTVLPVSCATGDSFLNTAAAPGRNVYICTAPGNPGTWTAQGLGGAPATFAVDSLTDFSVSTNGSVATVGCPSGQCQVRIGEKTYVFTANATASALTGSAGATVVFFYVDSSGAMDFGYDGVMVTGATLSGLNGAGAVSNYPANVIPLAHCSVSSNQFGTCFDDRAMISRSVIDQGTGVIVTQNPTTGHTAVSVNSGTVPLLGASNTFSGALNDFSGSQIRMTTGSGVPSPATCTGAASVGYLYVRSDAGALNSSVYGCDKTGAASWGWELLQYSSNSIPAGVAVTTGANTYTSGTQDFSAVQFRTTTGSGIPPASSCAAASNVGYLYIRNDAAATNASVYSCDLTGPASYAWELIQSSGGGGGSGSGGGGGGGGTSLSIAGPYLTNGSSYWISGSGQQATLFNNTGFSFKQAHATYTAINNVGYIALPAGSTSSDNYETASSTNTIIATFNINDLSGTGGNNGTVGIAFRNGSTGVECGINTSGVAQPTGTRPYMNDVNSAYTYQGNVAATGTSLASPVVTLKLTYVAQVSTCYFSTDGGFTYTTIGAQNGAVTGYLNSAPTASSINVSAGGYGAAVGILSWLLQ